MYFIAIKVLDNWKARDRTLYATKREAQKFVDTLNQFNEEVELKVMDADHEPGRSILRSRHGFS